MFPTLIQVGDFRLATYGLLVAAGYLASIYYLSLKREKMGLDEAGFWRLVYWLFFGAIAGGKLMYWAVEWRALLSGVLRPVRDFRYGFVFYGGLLGAALLGVPAARSLKRSYLALADYFALALPIGHGIGRLGCLMAGCCSGRACSLLWVIRFTDPESLVPSELRGVGLHPVQLYEALGEFAIAAALSRLVARIEKGRLPAGSAAVCYVASYALLRFATEFFRGDDRGGFLLGLSVSQWFALASLCVAAGFWIVRARKGP